MNKIATEIIERQIKKDQHSDEKDIYKKQKLVNLIQKEESTIYINFMKNR